FCLNTDTAARSNPRWRTNESLIASGTRPSSGMLDELRRLLALMPRLDLVVFPLNGECFVAPSLAVSAARGGSIPGSGAVTNEQRSHRPNCAQPEGRQSFSLPQNGSHLGDTTRVLRTQRQSANPCRRGITPPANRCAGQMPALFPPKRRRDA